MDPWIDQLARTLGEEPLAPPDASELLVIARDVAHHVERKVTPLSTFLLGVAVGRRLAAGDPRWRALADGTAALRSILPDAPAQGG